MMRRNVAWLEARQDRASDSLARVERVMMRAMGVGWTVKGGSKGLARMDRLAARARCHRAVSARYAHAKTKIGVYDRALGWRDA